MKCKLFYDTLAAPTIPPNKDILRAGAIIDHQNAFILVQIGMAEAVDEECEKAVNRTPEQLAQAKYEYVRTKKGIHPSDYSAYAAGKIDGYNRNGTVKPGPNYTEEEIEEDEDDDE